VSKTARDTLMSRYAELEEIKSIMYLLPADGEIQTGSMELILGEGIRREYAHIGDPYVLRELMATFRAEFEILTDDQKAVVMAPALDGYYRRYEDYDVDIDLKEEYDQALHEGVLFYLRGKVEGKRFNNEYVITDDMPRTQRALVYLFGKEQVTSNYYEVAGEGFSESPEAVLTAFKEDAADPDFTKTFAYLKGTVRIAGLSADGEMIDNTFILNAEDYVRFAELLLNTRAITPSTKESEFVLTEDTYYLDLYNDRDGKYSNLSLNLRGVFTFTDAELDELKSILHIKSDETDEFTESDGEIVK
jgi:hypothetical protein